MTARDVLARQALALIEQLTAMGDEELPLLLQHALEDQRRWVLELRAPVPIRTTNNARRLHWGKTSAERRLWREVAHAEARRAKLPTGLAKVRIDIEVRFPDRHRRDAANLHDQLGKAVVDALGPSRTVRDSSSPTGWRVEPGYGLVANDDQGHVDGPHITIGEPVDQQRFPYGRAMLAITDLSGGNHA